MLPVLAFIKRGNFSYFLLGIHIYCIYLFMIFSMEMILGNSQQVKFEKQCNKVILKST